MSYHILRLLAEEDGELADARITEEQKRSMRFLVGVCEVSRSSEELMYLAGAFEDAAQRVRAEEQAAKSRRHPRAKNPPGFGPAEL